MQKVHRGNVPLQRKIKRRKGNRKELTEVKPILCKLVWTRFSSNAKQAALEENCRILEYTQFYKEMLNHRNRDVTKKEQEGLAKAEVAGRRFQPERRAQGEIGQRCTDSAQDEGQHGGWFHSPWTLSGQCPLQRAQVCWKMASMSTLLGKDERKRKTLGYR